MTYYMGDYYRGDYYQGDPGFLSFLGRIGKGVLGLGKGLLGIPSGGGGGGGSTAMVTKASTAMQKVGPIVTKILQRPGVKTGITLGAGALGGIAGGAALRAGRRAMAGPGGHRRMNVCNPKALRRAIRRTHGFSKLAMKTIHLVHPKKRVTFGGFKKRRKRA